MSYLHEPPDRLANEEWDDLSAAEPMTGRMFNWMTFGLSRRWVEQRLEPICERYQNHLNQSESVEMIRELESVETDWDILFLGAEYAEASQTTLEALVSRLSRRRPLEVVVAVAPAASSERQLALMRAGAVEVLTLDDPRDRLDQAVDHAIGIVQARRAEVDQQSLQLLNQLAVSVNHEINNPLTGLMGTAELLLMGSAKLDEKVQQDLKTIIEQCRRIKEVTSRLKHLNHLRTVPYGAHDKMIDLIGEIIPEQAQVAGSPEPDLFEPTHKLLVVDDNPLIVDLIVRLFDRNYAISAAACASDALSLIEKEAFDLVLSDLILPEMNGLELFRAIRRMRPGQKVLLTTAYHGDARVEQAIAEGALGCVYKPFQLEDLEEAIDEALKT